MKCHFNLRGWSCDFGGSYRWAELCEACCRAHQQWMINDGYEKQVKHYEDNYLAAIDRIIEVKVKQQVEKVSKPQTP